MCSSVAEVYAVVVNGEHLGMMLLGSIALLYQLVVFFNVVIE